MATQRQFEDLLRDIEPSDSTKKDCSAAHRTLRDGLASHPHFRNVHVNTYLSGSYARQTAIRPRKSNGTLRRPDVDIIVVTNHTRYDNPADVISLIRRTLRKLDYEELDSNRRSVSVTMSNVEMDVVPIISDESSHTGWLIPDKDEDMWLPTNPLGHNTWATEVNKRAQGAFIPLVKLVKWWKREGLPHLRRPKGFILETLVSAHMDMRDVSQEERFIEFLEKIVDEYGWQGQFGGVPQLEDPSVPGNNVFSRVKPEEFKRFYELAEAHAQLLRRAQVERDPDKALALYRRVFGERFGLAIATRVGAGLLATAAAAPVLAFPAHKVQPPNKPQGFA
ncbi:MAG: Nucleotidyltransferase [Frankiales bacterium]|nr:Nucleotidyltransferase [Frankiales bacterium]